MDEQIEWTKPPMDTLQLLALQAWHDASNEGLLVIDAEGTIRLVNPRLQALFKLDRVPETVGIFLRQTEDALPELRALLTPDRPIDQSQWGSLRVQKYPLRRLSWQQVPLVDDGEFAGTLTIFREATTEGQQELAKQSFLSMISHDLRTPLSTILGFAELLYHSRDKLTEDERIEFLEHIINNANELTQYTQIALDIMYLEADMQNFEVETVFLERFIRHWLVDALHRFSANRFVYHNGVTDDDPMAYVSPAALHKILHILLEFALEESPSDSLVEITLRYDESLAHIIVRLEAPELSTADAAELFRLMYPRDLSESGRPLLHRMQLYVASLLAQRQQGYLTIRGRANDDYQLDLTLPLVSS